MRSHANLLSGQSSAAWREECSVSQITLTQLPLPEKSLVTIKCLLLCLNEKLLKTRFLEFKNHLQVLEQKHQFITSGNMGEDS